jgi:uncharacterized membrane protein YeaQ/YmgE (transglycosylase-associated protein family)
MQNTVNLIIQLISGAMGGNLAGGLFKKLSLGMVLNSILGILGGGLCGQLLNRLGFGDTGGPSTDLGSVVANILGGVVGGVILMAIIGALKKAFSK